MWATKNRHLDSSSRRIRSRLRIGKKYFGPILEGSDCMAILGATFFPFMLSFILFGYLKNYANLSGFPMAFILTYQTEIPPPFVASSLYRGSCLS
jgi:hypothetical protein